MKKIDIKGAIVSNDEAWIYELFEIEHTSPKQVTEFIETLEGRDVMVEINSGGGSVFAGSEIYTAIKKLNATVEVVGLAGSAASFIAMAGKEVNISPTAQIMIHEASTIAVGNKGDMSDTSDFLNSIDSSIAYAYQLKTGLDTKEIADMMEKETWLNAQQAVEKGFADSIMFEEKYDAVASAGFTLPSNVVSKVRNIMKQKPENDRLEKIERKLEDITNKLEGSKEPRKAGSFNMLKKWR